MAKIKKDYKQIFTIRGEEFEVTAPALFDDSTNELLYDEELDDKAIEMANDLYREAHGFVYPSEIKKFRERLSISGRDLAALIGFSPTTIVMYENGALPTESNSRKLKDLINNKNSFKNFYEANKSSLGEPAQKKIEDYLNDENDLLETIPIMKIVDWFRIKNIILQKSDEYVEDLTQMKVMKLVYYAQAVSLHWYGKPLFSNPILAWKHGPVVQEIYNEYHGSYSIVEDLRSEIPEELLKNYNELSVNKKMSKVLNFVQEHLGSYSAWTLRDKTHNEEPWINTIQSSVISNKSIKKYFDDNFENIF